MSNANGFSPPTTLPVKPEAIPAELKLHPRFLIWDWEYRPQNTKPWTKPPLNPRTGKKADATDQSNLASFDEALAACSVFNAAGVGFSLTAPFAGVDLDNCIRLIDGKMTLAPWAAEIIARFNTYTELSPSGKGVRIFCKATLPGAGLKYGFTDETGQECVIEVYSSGRYLTLTGWQLDASRLPSSIEDRQEQATALYADLRAKQQEKKQQQPQQPQHRQELEQHQGEQVEQQLPGEPGESFLTDDEVIQKASHAKNGERFRLLYSGAWKKAVREDGSHYPSQSEADQALCNMLAYWCNNDKEQIDRLFQQSGLMRDKWESHPYYAERTIENAIDATPEPYRPFAREQEEELAKLLAEEPAFFPSGGSLPVEGASTPPRRRRAYTFRELEALPPPKWLIHHHFTENSLVVLYGESGSLKSFTALDYGLCIATGTAYQDIYPVQQGAVVYICSEGWNGAAKRMRAWAAHHQQGIPDNFVVIPDAFDLMDGKEADEIIKLIKEALPTMPVLIIVDTLARNFGGGDENTQKDMNLFVRNLDYLRARTMATVMPIHHSGKDLAKRERGSSVLRGAADTRIELVRSGDLVTVSCQKQKDDEEFSPYTLKKMVVAGSVVLLKTDEAPCNEEPDKLTEDQIFEKVVEALESGNMTKEEIKSATKLSTRSINHAIPLLRKCNVIYDQQDGRSRKLALTETYAIAFEQMKGSA
jgi:putative DNA primase/helicase